MINDNNENINDNLEQKLEQDLDNKVTVGIPLFSKILATCPTDMWHTGQAGTNKTPSTFWDIIISTHCGAAFLIKLDWLQAPTKE